MRRDTPDVPHADEGWDDDEQDDEDGQEQALDDDFDYDDFVDREFGGSKVSTRLPPLFRWTALGILALIAIVLIRMLIEALAR